MNKLKYKLGQYGLILTIIVFILIPLLLAVGWFRNLIKFVKLDFKQPYKAEIIRGVGISPVGSILGWINIKDN